MDRRMQDTRQLSTGHLDRVDQTARNSRKQWGTHVSIQHIESGETLSRATVHGGIAYLCGLTASDYRKDIEGQTGEVLARIDDVLAKCGTDKSKLLTATVYLADMTHKARMNTVWSDWLGDLPRPSRACVGAPLAGPDVLIEIVVSAVV